MDTRHERILKRNDGSRVKIITSLDFDPYITNRLFYDHEVLICGKGKRKWKLTYDEDCYEYRSLNAKEGSIFVIKSNRKYVKDSELLRSRHLLWEQLRP